MNNSFDASNDDVQIGDYVAVLVRRRGIIAATVAIVIALTAVFVSQQTPTYEASATVLVRPITRDPLDGLERPSQLIDLSTEAQIVTSTTVGAEAAESLDVDTPVSELLEQVEVEAPDASQLLIITFVAGDAQRAADGAKAFANAYLDYRGRTAAQTLASSVESLQQRLDVLNDELETTNSTIAKLSDASDDPRYLDAQAQRSLLSNQIALLSSSLTERQGVDITAGDIIGPANVPETPSAPNPVRALAIAAVAGLLLGVAVAFLAHRLDGRVDTVADVARAAGAPVLATVRDRRRPRSRRGRIPAMSELYRKVAIALSGAAEHRRPFVVVVVSGQDLPERRDTATQLATALARDRRVLIVDGCGGRHEGEDDPPVGASDANRPTTLVPVSERLDLWTARDDTGLTAGAVARRVEHAGDYDVVVVDAEPVLGSADALELHDMADHVVVVARLRVTSEAELRQVRAQLATVGMHPVGVVVHDTRRGATPASGRGAVTVDDRRVTRAIGRSPAHATRADDAPQPVRGDTAASDHAHA